MKTYILPSLKLSFILLLICAVLYPLLIAGIAKTAPGKGKGSTVSVNGKVVGYENIGQRFTEDTYFQGRPSAVNYNAAGSGGSNKAPSNAEYLTLVNTRIDSFLVHNPDVKKSAIPSELVTASGSGLDPDISPEGAMVQVKRIAKTRNINEEKLKQLIAEQTEKSLLGFLGPEKVNVLKLNIALDQLK